MSDQISLRPGKVQDATTISALGTRVFTHSFSSLMPQDDLATYLSTSYSVPSIIKDLENPSMSFIVATKNDELVGFIQLTRGTSEPCIDHLDHKIQLQRLYVSEKCQDLGIGRILMTQAESEAVDLGFRHMWLASWERNPRAEKMYERAGYAVRGEMQFRLGSSLLKDWVMVKTLGEMG
ncbi:acetyltransferase (GNAT) family domain-containing protein [Pochonia chlamydosporia 170]|uniref:Acetyltransferase (GNAT) family domain-containing protein n=1 Tax=Pochonia chlamydosporia 170 TaxID=1380566 RepID=A0A179FTJ8_METCM|nr:acetyltransferase (GNAT) family domain-containing protein [Pochonia chlamydosporia 170]OAQ68578.1 acetyltransferase (GNAT) family domain-containing protein [Pochonia chlamydosporia 170]